MRFALHGAERVEAERGIEGACPGCGARVVPKCGDIVAWHWSHLAGKDCDPWFEPESEWHRDWKSLLAPAERQEVVMRREGVVHRADVVMGNGHVCEIQHSAISPAEIAEREAFYRTAAGGGAWLFDARSCDGRFQLDPWVNRHTTTGSGSIAERWFCFQWKRPRESWFFATAPMFWDVGSGFVWKVGIQLETPWLYACPYPVDEFVRVIRAETPACP